MTLDASLIEEALGNVTARLLESRKAGGWWEGQLSSSALSTATAAFALGLYQRETGDGSLCSLVRGGMAWLVEHQNEDGGWGDTVLSLSNISTTALCWAALSLGDAASAAAVRRAEQWLAKAAGSLDPPKLAQAITTRYGKDHTFSVPILTMCALAGRLGTDRRAWRHIPQLPFELAACPYQWFQWIKLPVVSYALPALIAMGHVRHIQLPSRNPVARIIRGLTWNRSNRVLTSIQPSSGGFLEATPLTSFVVMSLVGGGQAGHRVTRQGIEFLIRSAGRDGSWPIDTNLATWVTTLSVNALASGPGFDRALADEDRGRIREWLLGQQYRVEHPYTHAAPGGWAWTDLPGGVPDADDTAGALLALWNLGRGGGRDGRVVAAVTAGVTWLLDLQNRDGGIPTFCRGWGNLPFDRSGCDLTAHALHAWSAWREHVDAELRRRIDRGIALGLKFLEARQRIDGAWAPLWFGNQFAPEEENLTYGTARVVTALGALERCGQGACRRMIERGAGWLIDAQNANGGWGGAVRTVESIEETALAVTALAADGPCRRWQTVEDAVARGVKWLVAHTQEGRSLAAAPIGFYFAKLWYFERQYPVLFTVGALGAASPRRAALGKST